MSSVTSQKPDVRDLAAAEPLDEVVWQAWVLKGRAQEESSYAARVKAVKWILLAGLLVAAAAGFRPELAPYDVFTRFFVTAGAMVLMLHAFHGRHYALAAVFGTMAVLYNPVVLLLGFSGDFQRSLVALSAVPVIGSFP